MAALNGAYYLQKTKGGKGKLMGGVPGVKPAKVLVLGGGIVGEAASGMLAEDPSKFSAALLLQALPGTQGIYGFVTAFLIMQRINLFNGVAELSLGQGMYLLAAALPIAIVGYFSAIAQGRVAASGIELVSRREGQTVKAITSAALVETYAIFSLLVSLLPILTFTLD